MNSLEKELAEVVRLACVTDASVDRMDTANAADAEDIAASNFIRVYHAEIDQKLRRLEALERAMSEQLHPGTILDLNMRADEIVQEGE